MRFIRPTIVALALAVMVGCAGGPGRSAREPPLYTPPTEVKGVVFCADGAGGLGGTTTSLQHVVSRSRLPLHVQMVDWSHGPGRFAADHLHLRNIKAHAQDLAIRIDKLKRRTREQRVYLVGHSAGCLVVLLAAQTVSEDSVDRIILLAPSVSTTYDLRPALRSSRLGIDVFYSRRDVFVLGLGMAIFGTSDRRWSSAAGRVGFRPLVDDPGDRVLYAKLRQHEWHPERAESGHNGGHWGGDSPGHVHTYILPLLKDR